MAEWKYPGRQPKDDRAWQTWLQNLKPLEERAWISMGGGLTVAVDTSGAKTFQVRVRRIGDKNARRIAVGSFPACSVAEARQRVAETRSAVKEGRDPALERRRAREKVEAVASFGVLVGRYLERRAESGDLRDRTLRIEAQALAPLRRALGDRLLADLEAQDFSTVIEREVRRLRKAGGTGRLANLMLGAVKRVFKDARGKGAFKGPSPVADLSRPAKEQARNRILYDGAVLRDRLDPDLNETGRLIVALRSDASGLDLGARSALLLALMLGVRAGEISSLPWEAVRLDDPMPVLVIVAGKTEAASRVLPLPRQAVTLLRALRAQASGNAAYVFPAGARASRVGHMHPESLSRVFVRVCASLKIEGAVLHDCRRTCLSALMELTGDEALAERIAGHKSRSTLSMHYDRSKRLEPMLKALTAWADAVDDAAARAQPLALPAPETLLGSPR